MATECGASPGLAHTTAAANVPFPIPSNVTTLPPQHATAKSGTEPLVRVMAEGDDPDLVTSVVDQII